MKVSTSATLKGVSLATMASDEGRANFINGVAASLGLPPETIHVVTATEVFSRRLQATPGQAEERRQVWRLTATIEVRLVVMNPCLGL